MYLPARNIQSRTSNPAHPIPRDIRAMNDSGRESAASDKAADQEFHEWAMGDSNPRPLPCEDRTNSPGRAITCRRVRLSPDRPSQFRAVDGMPDGMSRRRRRAWRLPPGVSRRIRRRPSCVRRARLLRAGTRPAPVPSHVHPLFTPSCVGCCPGGAQPDRGELPRPHRRPVFVRDDEPRLRLGERRQVLPQRRPGTIYDGDGTAFAPRG